MRQLFYLAAVCFMALALSACGGDSSDSSADETVKPEKTAKESAGAQSSAGDKGQGSAQGLDSAKAPEEAKKAPEPVVFLKCGCHNEEKGETVRPVIIRLGSSEEETQAKIQSACEQKEEGYAVKDCKKLSLN